jgi:ABC-2 type transport system ATP-binding protein
LPPADLALPATPEDNVLRFNSEQPLEEIGRLAANGVKFASLKLTQPNLESVFLSLTGRSLRDE